MTPIQWALVELPYLSQDFVIVLALVYMIVGMLSTALMLAYVAIVEHGSVYRNWWWSLYVIEVMVILWPYVLWLLISDD
jgi:hypothetical protein